MRRLIQSGDPLYLPITQDPVPKTEDQLEEDAQVMMQLGTDKYASEMRARMMSASLLSDMESFKVRVIYCTLMIRDVTGTFYIPTSFVLYNNAGGKSGRGAGGLHPMVLPEGLDRRRRCRRVGAGKGSVLLLSLHAKLYPTYLLRIHNSLRCLLSRNFRYLNN